MNYFADCKTQDEVKKKYRELANKVHPDHGGNEKDMVELNKQYADWKPPQEQKTYSSFTFFGAGHQQSGYQYNNQSDINRKYKEQQNNPLLRENLELKSLLTARENDCFYLRTELYEIRRENESLKKKLERWKKKLKTFENIAKSSSAPIKRSQKKSSRETEKDSGFKLETPS